MTATTRATHTPGPWRVIDRTDILALEGTSDSIVVATTQFFAGEPTERQIADAQLIATAPDLLMAAKALWDADSSVGEDGDRSAVIDAWVNLIDVIERAEGPA